jgi:hypothetical protein
MGMRKEQTTDVGGGGQSGTGSGRRGDDPSMGVGYRNQAALTDEDDELKGIGVDDRFTGRGGESPYIEADDSDEEPEADGRRFASKSEYNSGYNRGGVGFGGPSESETVGKWSNPDAEAEVFPDETETSIDEKKTTR